MLTHFLNYRNASNKRPPSNKRPLESSRKNIVQWILTAWARLSPEIIANSFKSCGLNLNTDGSDDGLIHCFKEKQPCEAGAEILKSQLSVLDESQLPNPFEGITDSDVEEADNLIQLDEDQDEDEFIDVIDI